MSTRVALVVLLLAACHSSPTAAPSPGAEGFDSSLDGWRVDSTGGRGPHAAWGARPDAHAISPPNVMALQATNHRSEDRFNLFWTKAANDVDGRIAVAMRADTGEIDQGGGPMWRVQDADNYYLCRLNPLESNFRVYVVKDGVRRQLGTALVEAKPGQWHRLEANFVGDHITCAVDGEVLLDVRDATIPQGGGHGLWTKADACTSFDDLVVEPKK